ncbi:LysR family transcriptional regulator [Luteibacter anthropi]|uniref:LysR family transcriptional regulator n=1 Tax=Luteibacter anthropi TaxID=564369 RepID=UPI002032AB9F|nr:LysR family transcriptional regulator [Luteibacter anthropi]URX63614.1 LysR family transcriptional regulator [Luteibacter anthropi]
MARRTIQREDRNEGASDNHAMPKVNRTSGMLDDLNELRTFQLILSHGSLSGAARTLDVGLGVVSKRLATLERRVGHRLIHRTTRRLVPTDEGLALLEHVDRVLAELDAAESYLAGGKDAPTGILRVGCTISLGTAHVAPVIATLVEMHPSLQIELVMEDWPQDPISCQLDVAIYLGRIPDNNYVARKLVDNRRILVASPAYLAAHGTPQVPDDLLRHACLRWFDGRMPWKLTGPDGQYMELVAPSRLRSNHGDVIHGWCLEGRGIMFKSSIDLADDLAAGKLVQVLPDWAEEAPICALLPTRRHLTPKIRVFLDAIAARLASFYA